MLSATSLQELALRWWSWTGSQALSEFFCGLVGAHDTDLRPELIVKWVSAVSLDKILVNENIKGSLQFSSVISFVANLVDHVS